jgi:uncharacterized membrane protein YfcA
LLQFIFIFSGGVLAGAFGAILGLGGGVLLVPLLTLIFGLPINKAIGISLVAIIATSSGAAGNYLRSGVADLRLGLILVLATAVGGGCGGYFAVYFSHQLLSFLFGLVLLYASVNMVLRRRTENETPDRGEPGVDSPDRRMFSSRGAVAVGGSFFAGGISGLLGVGGGIVQVPIMYLILKVPLKVATATSAHMIGITALSGSLFYYFRGEVDPLIMAPTTIGVFLGATLGSWAAPKIRADVIKSVFVAVLLYSSLQMFLRGLGKSIF